MDGFYTMNSAIIKAPSKETGKQPANLKKLSSTEIDALPFCQRSDHLMTFKELYLFGIKIFEIFRI